MRSRFLYCLSALLIFSGLALAQTDTAPAAPIKGKKVCVADVANSSLLPVLTDNLKQRMVEDLQKVNINGFNAGMVTVLASQLGVTANARAGAKRQKCDFVVLSEVAKAKAEAGSSSSTGQSSAGSASSKQLEIDFALFKRSHWSQPMAANSVSFTAEGKDPNPAALTAMDQVASQIATALKK